MPNQSQWFCYKEAAEKGYWSRSLANAAIDPVLGKLGFLCSCPQSLLCFCMSETQAVVLHDLRICHLLAEPVQT